MMRLSEKEFEIINVIADGLRTNQRSLSTRVGISLGMTNLLLRRLVMKGYLRARQLTPRKIEYILTPRGVSEKTQKSFHYTLKTIESLGLIRLEIRSILQSKSTPDINELVVMGEGHLTELVWLVAKDYFNGRVKIKRIDNNSSIPVIGPRTLLLYTGTDMNFSYRGSGRVFYMVSLLSNRVASRPLREENGEQGNSRKRYISYEN